MGKVRVVAKAIYSQKSPTPQEAEAGVTYEDGGLKYPELIDKKIENPVEREKLPKNRGNISITVLPGDELGEFTFNVQFEGKRKEYEFCVQQQDELFQEAAAWLSEILGELGCDFEAVMEAEPCPHAESRVQLALAARRLERVVGTEQAEAKSGRQSRSAAHRASSTRQVKADS